MSHTKAPDYVTGIIEDLLVEQARLLQRERDDSGGIKYYIRSFLNNFNVLILWNHKCGGTVNITRQTEILAYRIQCQDKAELETILREHFGKLVEIDTLHPYPLQDERLIWGHYFERYNGITDLKTETVGRISELLKHPAKAQNAINKAPIPVGG